MSTSRDPRIDPRAAAKMVESQTLQAMMRWPNRRKHRAQSLVHEVMRVVGPLLDELDDRRHYDAQQRGEDTPPRAHRNVIDALMSLITATGVEFVTDHDREQCGLPPRGPDGWTLEELMAMERVRLDLILRPPPLMTDLRPYINAMSEPGNSRVRTDPESAAGKHGIHEE